MTLSEMRNEIWRNLGSPSEFDPSTDVSYNSGPYLNYVINLAQGRIATYKLRSGRLLRFRNLIGEMYFKTHIIEGTLDAAGTTSTVIFPSGDVGTGDDRYNGWIVEVDGEYRLVVDYDTASRTATVHDTFSDAPAIGDTYGLYKSFSLLLPSTHAWVSEHIQLPAVTDRWRADGNLMEVLKIEDLAENRELSPASRGKSFVSLSTSTGDPSKWYRFGNKIYFDMAQEDERWMKMEYYRTPTDLSEDTDEPEIPEAFHYAIVLWGTEWGYRYLGESTEKYSSKLDFREFLELTVGPYDIQGERSSMGHGILTI